jgi:uncharacterized protein YjbI with pentapeptide repeats
MNKKIAENIAKTLPSFFKNAIDYLKTNFQEKGKKLLENAGGTFGVLINLFAQPLIDKYFDNLSEKKLDNFGFNIYLKSCLLQARESLEVIKGKLDDSLTPDLIFDILNKSIKEEIAHFNEDDVILIFQPQYHPAAVYVKKNYQRILSELNLNSSDIKTFLKSFNENIETTVAKEFGEDYDEHLKRTEKFRFKESETTFLWDTIQQGKIGFKDTEDLKYEATYAQWKKVSDFRQQENEELEEKENEELEKKLKPIDLLIEEYFARVPNNHLEEILFVVADFGKGKSVFMKHYAADLAKEYLQTSEGSFPVYFNLRNFKNYSSESRLGVISDYLETRYSIKIDDEYFQKKKYVFLVDSLDESGELNKRAIDKVITSVKNIQGINKLKYKTNRIIITSRPFDEGFSNHLNDYKPYTIKNKENRDIPHFINVYGFTKSQFNHWLFETLSIYPNIDKIDAHGFAKQIISAISENQKIDIYEKLLKNKTLSRNELRRPIFAYMIYQLIINNVDFLAVGKLGVYMSFLNLLTKEAKHIHDVNYKVNLKEEFEFRNILQATASLWMYERQSGKQGILKKADICRVLEGKNNDESDSEILERFKGEGFTEIQFLSHSYFGENDNILHFQHQSFAEILLAEYYLKVFIKYSLDQDADAEEARVKLVIGEPTEQTILFLREMLRLLRETAVSETTKEVLEKRKLLFPLMASLAIKKHNRLFCNDIFYSWYSYCNIGENQTEYPQGSLENWCIDQKKLNKIIDLASVILNSKTNYLPVQANSKTALFDSEVLKIHNQNLSSLPPNIDQWVALLFGNILYNDLANQENPKLFNWDYGIDFFHLFEMIRSWNYVFNDSGPYWGKDLFSGINMQKNNSELDLSHYNFDGLNFSYSYLKHFKSWGSNWSRCVLNYCYFDNVTLITSLFFGASILNIKNIIQPFYMINCSANSSNLKLLDTFNTDNMILKNRLKPEKQRTKPYISSYDMDSGNQSPFETCSGFFMYGLQNSFFTIKGLKELFDFENEEVEKIFCKKIDTLKKYEVKKIPKKIT